jgi:nucleoside-diphosphate-sugar epimerase
MKINKAFITGAAGFIGSHLVKKLIDNGIQVLAIDDFSNYQEGRLNYLFGKKKSLIKNISILDRAAVRKEINIFGKFDIFFDLAYINGTKQFYSRALEILSHSGLHIQESLYWADKIHCRWIYFSTPEIYGEPEVLPTSERHPIKISDIKNPRFSYAIGKIYSESFIYAAMSKYQNLDSIIVRPNNAYGPTDRNHVISDIIDKILSGEDLTIQGSGEETRSFCYIDDIVNQIILVSNNGKSGECYNIGSDEEIKIKSLVNKILSISGKSQNFSSVDPQLGSPLRRCPDISKLKKLGNYYTTSIDDGLKRTWENEINFRNSVVN